MPDRKKSSSKSASITKKPAIECGTEKARRRPFTVAIPEGKSEDGALLEFINECLIPILGEKFVNEQNCDPGKF